MLEVVVVGWALCTYKSANLRLFDEAGLGALSLRCLLSRLLSHADAGPAGAGGEEDTENGTAGDALVEGAQRGGRMG